MAATLEVEGPDSGWVASIGFDDTGELVVLEVRDEWDDVALLLLGKLLQEPSPSGRIPGASVAAWDEDVLYEMAESLARRKPPYRGERLTGHVSGGRRPVERGSF
jgi:hypothetical protein